MRIFNTYGPRMRPNDGRAIPTFVTQALNGQPITVAGDGSQTRSVCYVDDLVEGALRLLFSDLHGPVNIGNPHEMSVLDLARMVREATGAESEITFIPRPQDDPSVRRPDITIARTDLGWEPDVSVADGLGRTVDWFREYLRQAGRQPTRRVHQAPSADPSERRQKVAVIGTGYVGAVTSTCLAWLGHDVCGLDIDPARAGQLNLGQVPFYEPGLAGLLTETLNTDRLRFTSDPAEALTEADVIFLCVGTPMSANGTPDLMQLESALQTVAPYVRNGTVVVNKSTVPVGCGNLARTVLEEALPTSDQPTFHVVSNPEFLREGSAITDFLHPDRVVLGGDESGVSLVSALYRRVLEQSFDGGRRSRKPSLITTELASAEMIKYAANAFLATKISFANEIANLCELVGADAREVLPAIGADHRIGPLFLSPGLGWGGSCFGKDVAALVASGQEYGYTVAVLRAVVEVNDRQRAGAVRKLQRDLHVLKGRRIAIFGLSFKPGTDDLRDAPALDIAGRLLAAGAIVSAYDPVVKNLPDELAAVRIAADPYDAACRADAIVLATEWPEFLDLDVKDLRRAMRGDLLLDGRNFVSPDEFAAAGVRVEGFGW
jgi:nucleotide sugar dehydrogenase